MLQKSHLDSLTMFGTNPSIGALVPGSGKDVWDADDDGTPKVFRDGVDNVSYPDPEAKMVPDDIRSEAILAYAVVAAQLLKKGKIDVLGHNIPGPYADDARSSESHSCGCCL